MIFSEMKCFVTVSIHRNFNILFSIIREYGLLDIRKQLGKDWNILGHSHTDFFVAKL